jgi:hypothetical protein
LQKVNRHKPLPYHTTVMCASHQLLPNIASFLKADGT